MLVTIISDASHCHEYKVTGMACWAKSKRVMQGVQETRAVYDPRIANATHAEVCAVILGIRMALMRRVAEKGDRILVQSDCVGVESYLTTPMKKGASEFELSLRHWLRQKMITAELTYGFKHVRGHQDPNRGGRFGVNVLCDRNAKRAMRKMRNSVRGTAMADAMKKAKIGEP